MVYDIFVQFPDNTTLDLGKVSMMPEDLEKFSQVVQARTVICFGMVEGGATYVNMAYAQVVKISPSADENQSP